jgi:exoribonuclease R
LLVEDLSLLAAAAGGMRASRLASGAIDFGELPLLKLTVEDSDVSVSEYDALGEQSRQLVAELMLLLNSWVAQVIVIYNISHILSSSPCDSIRGSRRC